MEASDTAEIISPGYQRVIAEQLSSQLWRINNLYKIVDDDGIVMQFRMKPVQELFYRSLHYRNIILKARQHGFTTLMAIIALDDALWKANFSGGIIAHTKPDAMKIFRKKVKFAYDNLSPFIKAIAPAVTKETADELEFDNGSSVSVSVSFRGGTLQLLHVCLAGDTDIITKNGVVKKIREISAGDFVMTDRGGYLPVRKLIRNKLNDLGSTLLSIKTFGYYEPLKITDNHEVLTREKATGKPTWKDAGDIKRGDYIAYPVREISNNSRDGLVPFGKQVWVYENGRRHHSEGERVPPSFDLGWLSGFYLAEGSTRRRNNNPPTEITFSIHTDETEMVIDAIKRIVKTPNFRVTSREDSMSTQITVNSRELAGYMADKFGHGKNKCIPDSVWKNGVEFCRGLVKGYFDGDGHYGDLDTVSAVSIRRNLIDQMKMLLLSLRIGYPSIYYAPAENRYGRNCKETWTIKLNGAANWKFREVFNLELPDIPNTWRAKWRVAHGSRPQHKKKWRRGKKHYWTQVTGIKACHQEEFVYDIALKKAPHNYVTSSGVVHNSELGKIAAKHPNKAEEIKTGAFEAVPKNGIIVVESTAEGNHGEFKDMVDKAQATEDQGRPLTKLDFKLHFVPWYKDPKYKLTKEETRLVPIPQRLTNYFLKLKDEYGILLTPRQKAWYVLKEENLGQLIWREYPSTPDEPFKVSLDGAYWARQMRKARVDGRITRVPIQTQLPVSTWWDIGRDTTSIWLTQDIGLYVHLIGYMQDSGEGLEFYKNMLMDWQTKHGTRFNTPHNFPHDMKVTEWAANKPRLDQANEMGLYGHALPRMDDKQDGIEAGRNFLQYCIFDEEACEEGIAGLEAYRKEWDQIRGVWKDTPLHNFASHPADAFQGLALNHSFAQQINGLAKQVLPGRRF